MHRHTCPPMARGARAGALCDRIAAAKAAIGGRRRSARPHGAARLRVQGEGVAGTPPLPSHVTRARTRTHAHTPTARFSPNEG